MNGWKKALHYFLLYFRYEFTEDLRNIRRRIWNKRLKLWWHRLFVRKDEFHSSLSTDPEAMIVMNGKELEKYHEDVARRRSIAHNRDLAREGKGS